jgi:thiamine biosynthesis lipoprotein
VRVERVMGTVIGIDVRSDIPGEALDHAFAYLHEVDARFSPFRPDSEIERLARGELSMADASDELLAVTALCHELRLETDGAFDAWATGRTDRLTRPASSRLGARRRSRHPASRRRD